MSTKKIVWNEKYNHYSTRIGGYGVSIAQKIGTRSDHESARPYIIRINGQELKRQPLDFDDAKQHALNTVRAWANEAIEMIDNGEE